jgi:predicted enzyme related to lactoylglutathione lyase
LKVKFKHTNIVARNWKLLAQFYEEVFGCVRLSPERNLSGTWLEKGTGVEGANLSGVHLLLPGQGKTGPTLEIYQYAKNEEKPDPAANREGFTHIAFEVNDVEEALSEIRMHGGGSVGHVTSCEIPGIGSVTFVYATDPEGNIIELQSWP